MDITAAFAVVLAGGRGERFWPLSTGARPKAFLRLTGSASLLQDTVRRARALLPWSRILVVAGQAHASLVREQIPELPEANLLLEPVGRDTAPAIGLAALAIERLEQDAVMAVLPADHHVPDEQGFAGALRRALRVVASRPGWVVTIGIPPARAETGYGYLEVGATLPEVPGAYRVRRFVEKPDLETATRLAQSPRHFWNSGIFLWRTSTIQELLARHLPAEWAGLCRIRDAWGDAGVLAREFSAFRRLSVDYGILERLAGEVAMVRGEFAWDDLGSWDALARVLPVAAGGNVTVGEVRSLETSGSVVMAIGRPVAMLGVTDLIVVATPDGVLVCPKGRSQELKRLVGEGCP
jgi:mannose-1-phosphate guanylyltransferase